MRRDRTKFECESCDCEAMNAALPRNMTVFSVAMRGHTFNPATCPRKLVTPASWDWLRLHGHYMRGLLPFSGGLLDQPNRFVEAMEVISDAEAERAVQDSGR